MFSIHELSEKIAELSAKRLDVEAFEDWFVASSWGHYSVDGSLASKAIAAVHHVLYGFQAGDIQESEIAAELSASICAFLQQRSAHSVNHEIPLRVGPLRSYASSSSATTGRVQFQMTA